MDYYNEDKYKRAKKKVKKEKDFYTHLTVYIVINTFLIIINLGIFQSGFTNIRIPTWPMFTTPFFWGIGLFFHWTNIFVLRYERLLQTIYIKDNSQTCYKLKYIFVPFGTLFYIGLWSILFVLLDILKSFIKHKDFRQKLFVLVL